jgi:hypothetical protein
MICNQENGLAVFITANSLSFDLPVTRAWNSSYVGRCSAWAWQSIGRAPQSGRTRVTSGAAFGISTLIGDEEVAVATMTGLAKSQIFPVAASVMASESTA